MLVAGLSAAVTGPLAFLGRQALQGAELWASYSNREPDTAEPPVRLIWYDDGGSAARVRANVQRLVQEDRVDLLLGPYGSHLTLAAAPIAEAARTLLWNHGGASDDLYTRGFRWVIGVASPASDYFRALPDWLGTGSRRRLTIVHTRRGTFGLHVARGLAEAAGAGPFVVERLALDPDWQPDAVLDGLRPIRPDLLILAGRFQDDVELVRLRHAWPESIQAVAAVAAGVSAFGTELGEAADGVIGCSQWEPDPSAAPDEGPDSSWFAGAFRHRFGQPPEYPAAAAFAAGRLAALCRERAGSSDPDRQREEACALDLKTLFGRFRLDPATGRQVGHRMRLVMWRGGAKHLR